MKAVNSQSADRAEGKKGAAGVPGGEVAGAGAIEEANGEVSHEDRQQPVALDENH